MTSAPTLRFERSLLRGLGGDALLIAMDEVGRGSLAGPVSVGAVAISLRTGPAPSGVRDSKLLAPDRRAALVEPIRAWATAATVGHASNDEIDALGIIGALRLAGRRAIGQLGCDAGIVLLDGSHDWLTPPPATLFDEDPWSPPPVRTRVKADLTCAGVAAASILAKVERDAGMTQAHASFPEYGWAENKGYASAEHRAALTRLGPCALHRRSWNLSTGGASAGGGPQGGVGA